MTAFKTDENLPAEAAEVLRGAGFDVVTVLDEMLGGQPDRNIAQVCRSERRALVTLDLDFANIEAYPPGEYEGIVVLRLARQDRDRVVAVLRGLLPHLSGVDLKGRLWIVEETRIRERR